MYCGVPMIVNVLLSLSTLLNCFVVPRSIIFKYPYWVEHGILAYLLVDHNVLGLKVTVDDIEAGQVFNCQNHLRDVELSLRVIDHSELAHHFKQLLPLDKLNEKIYEVVVLIGHVKRYDIFSVYLFESGLFALQNSK